MIDINNLQTKNFQKFKQLGYTDISTCFELNERDIPHEITTTATKDKTVYLFRYNIKTGTLTKKVLYYE